MPRLGFGTGFTDELEKPVIGNDRRLFSKHSTLPVILKTNLNQLNGMVASFLGQYILSDFCLQSCLGSNKRWSMVNCTFQSSLYHSAPTFVGFLLTNGRNLASVGRLIGKTGLLKTMSQQNGLF